MPKKDRALDTVRVGVEIEVEFKNEEISEKLINKHRVIPKWDIRMEIVFW